MAASKLDKLRRSQGAVPPGIADLMNHLANGVDAIDEQDVKTLETHGMEVFNHVDNLIIGGLRFTRTGLVDADRVTEDGLRLVGDVLYRFKGSFSWLIGDWLNRAGVYEWGEIKRVAIHFRLAVKTLQNWKSVSTSVPHSLRREELSFNHHTLVQSMSEHDQNYWLNRAVEGDEVPEKPDERKRWSVARLAKEIADDKKDKRDTGGTSLLDRTEVRMASMMKRWKKKTVTREMRLSIAAHLEKCAAELRRD